MFLVLIHLFANINQTLVPACLRLVSVSKDSVPHLHTLGSHGEVPDSLLYPFHMSNLGDTKFIQITTP